MNFNNLDHWVELAKLVEKGDMHGMFIADVCVSHSSRRFILQSRLPA